MNAILFVGERPDPHILIYSSVHRLDRNQHWTATQNQAKLVAVRMIARSWIARVAARSPGHGVGEDRALVFVLEKLRRRHGYAVSKKSKIGSRDREGAPRAYFDFFYHVYISSIYLHRIFRSMHSMKRPNAPEQQFNSHTSNKCVSRLPGSQKKESSRSREVTTSFNCNAYDNKYKSHSTNSLRMHWYLT